MRDRFYTGRDEVALYVMEDLNYLVEEWPAGHLTAADLRRASTIMRNLLRDGHLHQVWKRTFGREAYWIESQHFASKDNKSVEGIELANASKATRLSKIVAGLIVFNSKNSPTPPPEVAKESLRITEFLNACVLIVEGKRVSRREIINFCANKTGAHFDTNRTGIYEYIERSRAYSVLEIEIPFFELLSIGQAIAGSPCTRRLMETLCSQGFRPER